MRRNRQKKNHHTLLRTTMGVLGEGLGEYDDFGGEKGG